MSAGWKRGNVDDDRVAFLEEGIAEITENMRGNMEKLLVRNEKMDDLEVKAVDLNMASSRFQKSAQTLHRNMCCRKVMYTIILTVVVILILTIIGVLIARPWQH